uniref:Exosome complex component RRP45 n=1 Tax=Corethrella appendiculata TaxID=1370023 RepID=U5EZA1_9DIPT
MKETILSNCEKSFITKIIADSVRVDGRSLDQFRNLRINFGTEWGSVHVSLGETRILVQVSCEVVEPRATRPNEGLLFINVELGPMAAPHLESGGRPSDKTVQIMRILERAIKDSRCVDLESLCIVSEEKVWNLRVDLNVLNYEGNIIDCASIAALTALAHFKRPDVTIAGDEVIIHTLAEKDPIQIVLHHYPVCVSYAIFNSGKVAIADPTLLEERVAEATMIFGINSYRELCGLHLGGNTLTSSELLLKLATKAGNRAMLVVEKIKESLKLDEEKRAANESVGFTECIRLNQIAAHAQEKLKIRLKRFKLNSDVKIDDDENDEDHDIKLDFEMEHDESDNEDKDEIKREIQNYEDVEELGENSGVLVEKDEKNIPKWIPEDVDGDVKMETDDVSKKRKKRKKKKRSKEAISRMNDIESSDSDDEETVTLINVE